MTVCLLRNTHSMQTTREYKARLKQKYKDLSMPTLLTDLIKLHHCPAFAMKSARTRLRLVRTRRLENLHEFFWW